MLDLETQVERYIQRETESTNALREEVTDMTQQRDSIYDEWVEDAARGGWENQSGETNNSGEGQHARTATRLGQLRTQLSTI
eukprot:5750771-Amphidinium_carterae.1